MLFAMDPRSFRLRSVLTPAITTCFVLASLAGCGDDGVATGQTSSTSTASSTSGTGGGATTSSSSATSSSSTGGAAPTTEIQIVDLGMPIDLTPDGSVALIQDPTTLAGDVYFYNTATQQKTLKTQVGDPSKDITTGISSTLRVSAIHGVPDYAGIFSDPGGWLDLTSPYPMGCDPDISGAFDISADGKVAVGLLWHGCNAEAFRWTDTGGPGTVTVLEIIGNSPSGVPTNRASVISDDGKIAAGFAQYGNVDRSPAIWAENGTGKLLDPTNMDTPGEILSITSDGGALGGITGYDGFRWTQAEGIVPLARLATSLPSDPTFTNAIAAQGKLIFGAVGDPFNGIPVAFVWTEAGGSQSLQDIVVSKGLTIPAGYSMSNVLAASDDGSVLLGTVTSANLDIKTFVLKLPVAAYGI